VAGVVEGLKLAVAASGATTALLPLEPVVLLVLLVPTRLEVPLPLVLGELPLPGVLVLLVLLVLGVLVLEVLELPVLLMGVLLMLLMVV